MQEMNVKYVAFTRARKGLYLLRNVLKLDSQRDGGRQKIELLFQDACPDCPDTTPLPSVDAVDSTALVVAALPCPPSHLSPMTLLTDGTRRMMMNGAGNEESAVEVAGRGEEEEDALTEEVHTDIFTP